MKRVPAVAAIIVLLFSCDPDFNYLKDIGSEKIVFASSQASSSEICVVNSDCSGFVNLTKTNVENESTPEWSYDGTRIAFVRELGSFPFYHHVFVMNADGTGQTDLMTDQNDYYTPAWSPDGTKIAYQSDTPAGIYVMNADGSGKTGITNQTDYSPSWSPDGTRIAFSRNNDIFLVNSDGSGSAQPLTDFGSTSLSSSAPSWSPDGNQIVYQGNDGANYNIWIMLKDGAGQKALANNPSTVRSFGPSFSSDGTRIVFYNQITGVSGFQLYIMNADGSENKAVTTETTTPDNGSTPSVWGFVSG